MRLFSYLVTKSLIHSEGKSTSYLVLDLGNNSFSIKKCLTLIAFCAGAMSQWKYHDLSLHSTGCCVELGHVNKWELAGRSDLLLPRLSYSFWALCRKMYVHCVRAHDLFASLQLDRATTTGRLLDPTTCLPHKDGGIPLSVLPKYTTSKLSGLFSTLSLFCWAPSREAVNNIFWSLLVWLD